MSSRTLTSSLLLVAAVATSTHNPLAVAEDASKPDDDAVILAVEQLTAAIQAGDLDALLTSYSDDAAVRFTPAQLSRGAPQMRAAFAELAAMAPRFTYGGHQVSVVGDIALHVAPWTMQAEAPDGSTIVDAGLSVAVLKRDSNGRWKVLIDHPYGERQLDHEASSK